MASVSEHLLLLQKLTQTNLEILQSLNNSFYTKQDHLYADINDTKYVIPSFISLENKINMLEENFNNLVNAPASGEAYFNIDGNSRAIEVKSYSNTPNSLKLNEVNDFIVDDTNINILRELLTPAPKVRFNIPNIPNDIVTVNVKKIMAKSDALKEHLHSLIQKENESGVMEECTSVTYKYSDIVHLLDSYKKDVDYIEYNQLMRLPIRKNIGSGTYIVDSVISDIVDDNLDNYITLKIKTDLTGSDYSEYMNSLTYKLFDDTIERKLSVGDYLTNYDSTTKFQISDIKPSSNTITLKVVNGEFANIIGVSLYDYTKGINDWSKLRFFSPIDFDEDKYIDITLDDTQYVFIAVAPVNDRMNVQSSWGEGVLINSYKLINGEESFEEYYKKNVKNIGELIKKL